MKRQTSFLIILMLGLIALLGPAPGSRSWGDDAGVAPHAPLEGIAGKINLNQPPGHGPDATGEERLTARARQHKLFARELADEWASVLQLDTLSDAALAKIDGVVRNQAYWAVLRDPQVQGWVAAEVQRALVNGERAARACDGAPLLQSAADAQVFSAIVVFDAPPDAAKIGALAPHVRRIRHVLESIHAVSVDLTPSQLAAVAQLPSVHYIWPNAPVRDELSESVPQIGADRIHAAGIRGEGVRVAVVESSGLQDDHPEYDGRVVAERCDEDDGDHATHVAGIIAGDFDVTGVAPGVSLVDAGICPGLLESFWDDAIDAIEWAADEAHGNADVINLSQGADLWVYPRDGTGPVETAIDNLITQNGTGGFHTMVIKSAGNEADRHDTGDAYQHPDPDLSYVYWHDVDVSDTDEELQITLWWDNAGNDLDLKLYAPGDTQVDASQGSPGSTVGSNAGIVYEQVSASKTELGTYGTGTWQVAVFAHDVPSEPQFYHVAVDDGPAVFASPNPEGTVTVPGNARYAITVGSVQDGSNGSVLNQRTAFSSQGPTDNDPGFGYRIKPELMAPGEWIYSSVSGSGYGTTRGTSMAAPHVAGTVALLLQAAGKRGDGSWQLSYQELRGAVIDTASVIDGDQNVDNVTGAGLVQPTRAIFSATITHHGSRYFKIRPKYTSATYPGVTGQVLSFGWQSVAARWDDAGNDLDLYLYRLDNGAGVAEALTSNPGYEKINGLGQVTEDHDYVLRVYGWYVDGADQFYGVSTNDIQSVDPPALDASPDPTNPDTAYVDQTFDVRFPVRNDGDLPALNTSATLNLPSGVEIVSGSNPQSLGDISAGGQATATWSVRASDAGSKDFTLDASSSAWGGLWSDSGADSVNVSPPVGPLIYEAHSVDDDDTDQSNGDDNGRVDCGETIELFVTLRNQGASTASGVNAIISESDPYVEWLYNTSASYPDVAGGGTASNGNDFDFTVAPGTPDGHVIHFDLQISASNGGPWSDAFDVAVVCNQAPNPPENPSPADLAVDQDVNVDLSWSGGDPDPGENVTYDVFFEADDPTPQTLVCDDAPTTACDPGPLDYETDYYWTVVATDEHDDTAVGDTWRFTTEDAPLVGPLTYESHAVDDDTSGGSSGNGDGGVDCGETVELYAILRNQGSSTASGVNATLSENDPYVSLIANTSSSYPNVDGGATENNIDDYELTVAQDTPDGHVFHFDLQISASNGGPWSDAFDVPVECVLPDLTVTDVRATPSNPLASDPVTFTVDVTNDGGASTAAWGSFDVRCYLDGSPTPFDSANVSSLGAYASTSVACHWTATAGTHTVRAVVDEADAIPERNDGDNDRSEMIVVGAACNDTNEPNDVWGQATATGYGATLSGLDVCTAGDEDYYAFAGLAGDAIVATIEAESIGSSLDAYLVLYDTDGVSELTHNDNFAGLDSRLTYQLPADGTYYLKVRQANHPSEGGPDYFYTLSLVGDVEDVGPLVYAYHLVDDDDAGSSSGNDDGIINCGEDIEFFVALHNQGSDDALAVVNTITSTDPYITWWSDVAGYLDVAAGETVTNSTLPFFFQMDAAMPTEHVLQFDLDVVADNGGPWSDTFTTTAVCNHAPNAPDNPSPARGAVDQPVDVDLSWTGSDPDAGDSLTYDVYFEAEDPSPDELICENVSTPACDPGALKYATRYFWQVVAEDSHGATAKSILWYFDTYQPPVGPIEYVSHRLVDDGWWGPGDGDGKLTCGEAAKLYVTVINQGVFTATIVDLNGGHDDPYVTLINEPFSHPDIPGGATYENPEWDEFALGTADEMPDGYVYTFDLTVEASNAGPWTDAFDVPIMCPHPDLVVTDICPSVPDPLDGDPVQFAVHVTNQGDVTTTLGTAFDVDCYADGSGTPFDGGVIPSALASGETVSVTCDWTAVEGTHTITAVVDGGTTISEANELNNARGETFRVRNCADPHEPNETGGTATAIAYGATLSDPDVCRAGDVDVYAYSGQAGDYVIASINLPTGSLLDPLFTLYDTDGVSQLAQGSDVITYTLPADGVYFLEVREADHPNQGGPDYAYALALDRGAGPLVYATHSVDDDTGGWSSGDGDGVVDCGETIELAVSVSNQGDVTATGVYATISTNDPGISLLYGAGRDYPDIPGAGTHSSSKPFAFRVTSGVSDGHGIPFDVALQAANGVSRSEAFDVTVTCTAPDDGNKLYLPLILRAYDAGTFLHGGGDS